MKNLFKRSLVTGILFSCIIAGSCNLLPPSKRLNGESEKLLEEIKKELAAKDIFYEISEESDFKETSHFLMVSIVDFKNKNFDYDVMNKRLFEVFKKSKFNMKKYKRVSFFYITDESKAKVSRIYYYTGDFELVRISYD